MLGCMIFIVVVDIYFFGSGFIFFGMFLMLGNILGFWVFLIVFNGMYFFLL